MYMIDSMIDMGLRKGQKWPTPEHREVAASLALFNPLVKTRDALNSVVQKVCKIPKSRIKTISWSDLPKYGLGFVVAP